MASNHDLSKVEQRAAELQRHGASRSQARRQAYREALRAVHTDDESWHDQHERA